MVGQGRDEGARQGWCLYKLGCKGPETYANCPTILFGDAGGGTWPVGCGHPCIGCTEQGVGFQKPIHMTSKLKNIGKDLGGAIKGFKESMKEEEEKPAAPQQQISQNQNPPIDSTARPVDAPKKDNV